MKIVYLHQYFRTPESGGGTRSYEFAKQWVKNGHEVHIITAPTENTQLSYELIDGIKIHYISDKYENSFSYKARILVFLKFAILSGRKANQLNADIIYATSTPLTVCIPAIYCKLRKRTNYIFEIRDLWPDVPIAMKILRSKILISGSKLIERLAYRFASHIIVISPTMRDNVIAKGVSEEKVSCVTQGCDNSIFQNPEIIDHSWLPDNLKNKKIVIYAGAVSTANNLKYIVNLALQARFSAHDVRFVILGGGGQLAEIKKYAEELQVLDSYVHFLGQVSKFEVSKWMHVSTFTLSTFSGPEELWIHGAQNKFFDSISAGKPIATNYLGWQTKFSIAEKIGIYIDKDNSSLAFLQIIQTMSDYEWMAQVEENCKRLAYNSLNRQVLADQCLEILSAISKQS